MHVFVIEPHFQLDEDNVETKEIVEKILALRVEDMTWPIYLNTPVKIFGNIEVPNPTDKGKLIMKSETDTVDKPVKFLTRSAAYRTRSKKPTHSVVKPASPKNNISSDTMESSSYEKENKDDKELKMTSSKIYA